MVLNNEGSLLETFTVEDRHLVLLHRIGISLVFPVSPFSQIPVSNFLCFAGGTQQDTRLLRHIEEAGDGHTVTFASQASIILLVALSHLIVGVETAETMKERSATLAQLMSEGETYFDPVTMVGGQD